MKLDGKGPRVRAEGNMNLPERFLRLSNLVFVCDTHGYALVHVLALLRISSAGCTGTSAPLRADVAILAIHSDALTPLRTPPPPQPTNPSGAGD